MNWDLLAYVNNDTSEYTDDEIITIVRDLDSKKEICLNGFLTGVVSSCCNKQEVEMDYERYEVNETEILILQCRECNQYIISAQDI